MTFVFLDEADEVVLESDIPSGTTVADGTLVQFICTVDSNPAPILSLYSVSGPQSTLLGTSGEESHSYALSVVLDRELHKTNIVCSTDTSQTSQSKMYYVECKYIFITCT